MHFTSRQRSNDHSMSVRNCLISKIHILKIVLLVKLSFEHFNFLKLSYRDFKNSQLQNYIIMLIQIFLFIYTKLLFSRNT